MSKFFLKRVCTGAMLIALALLVASPAAAQTADEADAPVAKKTERAKPRGRLPNYYRTVVDRQQRAKIYAIQAQYSGQLEDLLEQIEQLKAKQNAEIEAVLTPEQRAEIAKIAQEAAAARKKAADAKKAARDAKAAGDSE